MGLDQYIRAYPQPEEVGYYRKFNAFHHYVEEHIAGRDDINCDEIELTTEDITTLLGILHHVKRDPEQANVLFPTASGFFFGSTEYDETYFRHVDALIRDLERLLKDYPDYAIVYFSWY